MFHKLIHFDLTYSLTSRIDTNTTFTFTTLRSTYHHNLSLVVSRITLPRALDPRLQPGDSARCPTGEEEYADRQSAGAHREQATVNQQAEQGVREHQNCLYCPLLMRGAVCRRIRAQAAHALPRSDGEVKQGMVHVSHILIPD